MNLLLILAAGLAQAQGLDSTFNLHNHTYCSDGSDTPEAFVEVAQKAGVKVVAVTDHDTVACIERAVAAGKKAGVSVVPGIEISAEDDSMHILGLGIDVSNPKLVGLMTKNRQARLDRARQTVEQLNKLTAHGKPIKITLKDILVQKLNAVRKTEGKPAVDPNATEEQLLAEAGPITRPDIALTMVAKGYVRDTREAFDSYLGDEGGAAAELDGPAFKDAIGSIHAAGGIAVLAHPHTIYKYKEKPYHYSGKTYRDFDAVLEDLLVAGLDGVEQYKAGHGPAEFIVAHAKAFGAKAGKTVLLTPGSDYHGASGVGQSHFDAIGVPPDMAKLIKDALRKSSGGGGPAPRQSALTGGETSRVQAVLSGAGLEIP